MLRKIGADARVTDVRWAAYILATCFIESSHTIKVTKQTRDKKGAIKEHVLKVWRNFSPADESGRGKGLAYGDPVKIFRLPTGSARITERDGDRWEMKLSGIAVKAKGALTMGVTPGSAAHATYTADEGEEHLYYGRGLVQITWWYNYAVAGITLGRGLDLLFKPELVNEPDTAYEIMANGMCDGTIFANKKKLSQYLNDKLTDYVGARNIVNPGSSKAHKVEVAEIAEKFEKILFSSKSVSRGGAK